MGSSAEGTPKFMFMIRGERGQNAEQARRSVIIVGVDNSAEAEAAARWAVREGAAQLGCSTATVGKWRRRFVADRLEGLTDDPRPGAPRLVSDDQIEQVVVATLERTPRDATHWSRASMAAEAGLSKSTVGRIWRASA
jgi:transposase